MLEDYLRHEHVNGLGAYLFDFDGTIVPKGKPKPCNYTKAVINRIKSDLVINTARWGPTCVTHHLGHDIKVIGAQGMEFKLSPGEGAEIWGDVKTVCQKFMQKLAQLQKEHPLVNINSLIHEAEATALFIQWHNDPEPHIARQKIIALLDRHERREDYHHRHIWNHDCGDVEVVPKLVDKRAAIAHALDDLGLFAGKTLFAAGDTPETDGPWLDEIRKRGGITAFVGDKHYDNAHLRFDTPLDFMSFVGRVVGLSPQGPVPIHALQRPQRIGGYSLIPVY